MRNRTLRWIAVGFAVFLAMIIILADFRQLPSFITMLYSFPYGDRIGHFVLFAIVVISPAHRFSGPRIQVLKRDVPVLTLILAVFIIGEEISQIFISARTFSWEDLAASLAGWGAGWGVGCWVSRNHR